MVHQSICFVDLIIEIIEQFIGFVDQFFELVNLPEACASLVLCRKNLYLSFAPL